MTNLLSWPGWPAALTMLAVAFLLVLGGQAAWRFYQARLFLLRRATSRRPHIERVRVKGVTGELFARVSLLRLARDFRLRREIASNRLHIPGTIARTVARGGWPELVYGTRRATPEYVVLIDRRSFADHQARFVQEMVGRLKDQEVFLAQYFFNVDPRLCFPEDPEAPPLTLSQLAARHPDHRLLLFLEAPHFFDSESGQLSRWAKELESWREVAVLTPERVEHWRGWERALARLFFVAPATVNGLSTLVQRNREAVSQEAASAGGRAPFPAELRLRPGRWLDRNAPGETRVEGMIAALRRYLGKQGFFWLGACAVYPEIHWNLTLHLGSTLKSEDSRHLLTEGRLATLARLPWLRHGYMPDWLRRRLISGLSWKEEAQVRTAIQELLLAELKGAADGFHLEIARMHRRSIAYLAAPILRLLSRREPSHSPLRDYTFLTFMVGRWQRKLAVQVPMQLRARLATLAVALRAGGRRALQTGDGLQEIARLTQGILAVAPGSPKVRRFGRTLRQQLDDPGPLFFNTALLVVLLGTMVLLVLVFTLLARH